MAMLTIDSDFLLDVTTLAREGDFGGLVRIALEAHAGHNETKRKNVDRCDSSHVSKVLVETLDAVFPTNSDKAVEWGHKTEAQRTLVVYEFKRRLVETGLVPPSAGE